MIACRVAVYLAVGTVDLRGAFDRLAALTRELLRKDPESGALYLFVNRRRNRLKALWWDSNGYTILYKRLARGHFFAPRFDHSDSPCIEISAEEFAALLAGLPIREQHPPAIH